MAETFRARLDSEGEGVFVVVPPDVLKRLSARRRPPVAVTVKGFTFRTTPAIYGGRAYLPFRRDIRQKSGVVPGEVLEITIGLDEVERTVELPLDLENRLLPGSPARRRFDDLSYTHRKEYADWVASAKRPETRTARAERTVGMLEQGIRTPQEARGRSR